MVLSWARIRGVVSDAFGHRALSRLQCGGVPRRLKSPLAGIAVWLVLGGLAGCLNSEGLDEDVLIRVDDQVVTVAEFNQAFEVAKTAYPHNLPSNSEDLAQAQERLLNQLVVELVLAAQAEELGIQVSDQELQQAVAEIQRDYPDDLFEQTMLEQAVSYESWEKRLRIRLLIDKVIASELKEKIVITADDIAAYYEQHDAKQPPQDDCAEKPEVEKDINELVVRDLRRRKAEAVFKDWLASVKKKYRIEIDPAQWEKISGSQTRSAAAFQPK